MTLEEFLARKAAGVRSNVIASLAKQLYPRKKGQSQQAYHKSLKAFKKTPEFMDQLPEALAKDKLYLKYTAEEAKTDPEILAEYEKARSKALLPEEKQILQDRMPEFMDYLCSNAEILVQRVRERNDKFTDKLIQMLTRDAIRFECSSRPYWRPIPLQPQNSEDFLTHFQSFYNMERERYFRAYPLEDVVLKALKRAGRNKYLQEYQALFEGLTEVGDDYFRTQLLQNMQQRKPYRAACEPMISAYSKQAGYRQFLERCSVEQVARLIRENPHYHDAFVEYDRQMAEERRKQQLLRQGILDRIPENPIDLFPLARQMTRRFFLHVGPTNSGKTYEALQALGRAASGIYLSPLRLLAAEVYDRLNAAGVRCGMLTGEEERPVPGAAHLAATVEMLDLSKPYQVAVIDEAQMLADQERGWAWTNAILGVLAREVHVCANPSALPVLKALLDLTGDPYTVVEHQRSVPLVPDQKPFRFPDSVRSHDALIVFSKRNVISCAGDLQARGMRCSIVYGALPYEVRMNEVQRYLSGETDVVVATDAIGMGLNLPIQRIVFLENAKFDGKTKRELLPAEVQQIAGRAGRQGMYDKGLYTAEYQPSAIQSKVNAPLPDLTEARLDFARVLVRIDGKLSEIMEHWSSMADRPPFRKTDLTIPLQLCKELEELSDNKELIYEFCSIPFNEKSYDLHWLWKEMFRKELQGEHLPLQLPGYNNELNSLEQAYQTCDLLYVYHKKFTDGARIPEIAAHKKVISETMMKLLATKKLPRRKCRSCGRKLPWNFPYGICEECHSQQYRSYGYGWW